MIYDHAYREQVTLADGTQVELRTVRPDDKALLQRGMARLSPQSRMRRFHYARGELSPAELTYLTEVDGIDHVAIGALQGDEGVAIARFIRTDETTIAEPAVAILDDLQGKGLGSILFARLVAAAGERGITHFRAEVLAENRPMLALFRKLSVDVTERLEYPNVVVVEVPLPEEPGAESSMGLFEQILALAAEGVLRFRTPVARGR